MEIVIFKTPDNKLPFEKWLEDLPKSLRFRIYQRLSRIEEGNFGDYKSLESGLYELRFHFDSGLRIYYTKQDNKIIILLCGGNKKTQAKDITLAQKYIKEVKVKKEER